MRPSSSRSLANCLSFAARSGARRRRSASRSRTARCSASVQCAAYRSGSSRNSSSTAAGETRSVSFSRSAPAAHSSTARSHKLVHSNRKLATCGGMGLSIQAITAEIKASASSRFWSMLPVESQRAKPSSPEHRMLAAARMPFQFRSRKCRSFAAPTIASAEC